MERLYNVADIAERYKCSLPTARKFIRQMIHMEHPLMVRESAVLAWEESKMVAPMGKRTKQRRKRISNDWGVVERDTNGKIIIPRRGS